jgi:hypothetical protein
MSFRLIYRGEMHSRLEPSLRDWISRVVLSDHFACVPGCFAFARCLFVLRYLSGTGFLTR